MALTRMKDTKTSVHQTNDPEGDELDEQTRLGPQGDELREQFDQVHQVGPNGDELWEKNDKNNKKKHEEKNDELPEAPTPLATTPNPRK